MKRFFSKFYQTTGIIKDPGQRSVASRVTAIAVEGAILFSLLGTVGIDTTPLITAAGVTGATLGFACKDFGANFVASIALAGQSSFRTGNKVTIGTGTAAVTGTVSDWDTRYLYLRDDKNRVLCVPNNLILNSVVLWENPGETPTANHPSPFGSEKKWTSGSGGPDAPKDPGATKK